MERSLDDGTDQEPPEGARHDVSEFVEVDPTGRYGRVWCPSLNFLMEGNLLSYGFLQLLNNIAWNYYSHLKKFIATKELLLTSFFVFFSAGSMTKFLEKELTRQCILFHVECNTMLYFLFN